MSLDGSGGLVQVSGLVALEALPASAIIIDFNPPSQSMNVGSTTTVDLIISGVGDGAVPSLGIFDLDIGFDSSILTASGGVHAGDALVHRVKCRSSPLSISVNALGDSLGDPPQAELIAASINSIRNVNAVPEPSSLLLVGIGMLGIMSLAKRYRSQRA